ncbi:MAG: hypothetical protein ACI9MN_001174 [Saprospiraceae bacterium]|jgi:hypothetical protein
MTTYSALRNALSNLPFFGSPNETLVSYQLARISNITAT